MVNLSLYHSNSSEKCYGRHGSGRSSQEERAFRAELDRTYISLLERGLRNPTLTTIAALAKALDVEWVELLK